MHNTLFLLCPTDCLEPIINNTFKQENYFYTSLGNSFSSDVKTLEHIKALIVRNNIRKIYFVLSNDNQIILNALEGHFFPEVKGLKTFYNEVTNLKELSETLWLTNNRQFSILSHYLNKKMKELKFQLFTLFNYPIEIKGQIFDRSENTFKNIYTDLICIEKYSLN